MLLDDAAGIPPVDNAKLYARMGIDIYCFSGGKGLRGPQCSGLLLGRKDLIEAALLNCSPREGAVCRPMKVGKEEVIGCLTALETWLKVDEKKLYAEWNGRMDRIRKLVETVPGVTTTTYVPERRKPLSDAEDLVGSTRLGIQDRRLRAGFAGRRSGHRSARIDNPSLVTAVREGNPNHKETEGTRSHRTSFDDDQAGRRNYRGTKTASHSGCCAEKGQGLEMRECMRTGFAKLFLQLPIAALLLSSSIWGQQQQVRAVIPQPCVRGNESLLLSGGRRRRLRLRFRARATKVRTEPCRRTLTNKSGRRSTTLKRS